MENIASKTYINQGNQAVLSLIPDKSFKILDVGCGGGNAQVLHMRGHVLDGITISQHEKRINSAFFNSIIIHNIEQGLPEELINNQYDIVLCSHVLEHICYPNAVLNDIRTVLQKGILIIALPNIMHYKSRLSILIGNFNYSDSGIWDNTHFKWYTFNSSTKLLKDNGFNVIKVVPDGEMPLLSIFKKILPLSIRKKIFKLLANISPGLFANQIILICEIK